LTVTDSVGGGELHLEAADAVTPMFRVTSPAGQLSSLYLSGGSYFTNGYFIRTSAEGASGCSNVWITDGEFTSTGSGGFYLTNAGDNLYLGSLTFRASGQGALADKAIYVDGESRLVFYNCTFSGTWSGAHIMLGSSGAPNLDLTKAGASIVGTKLATSVNTAATDIPLPRNYAFCTSSGRGVHLLEWGFSYEILSYSTYELRFDPNGGSGGMKTVYTFSGYVLPECAFTAPEGKSFGGWLVGGEVYQPGDAIPLTQDVSAMAQWKTPAVLRFDANGGSGEMTPINGFLNEYVELPVGTFTPPAGTVFGGWEIGGMIRNAGESYYFDAAEATANARWRAVYTVTLVQGGERESDTVFVGEVYRLPECPFEAPAAGEEFRGWVLEGGDGSILAAGSTLLPEGNITLTAKWGRPVTVSFAPNGGSGTMEAMDVYAGDPFIVPGCGIEPPEGQRFVSWLIEGGESCYPDDELVLQTDTTLIAQWKTPVMVGFAVANEYGDAEVYDMQEGFVGESFVLPACDYPVSEGMVFSHWIIEGGDGTRYAANAAFTLQGDVVFIAQWRDASFGAEWSVSGTTLSVTLGESAQTLVRRIIFAEYGANGQLSGVQIALPESGESSFVRGEGAGKLFFLDENGIPVLSGLNVT
ncbi:MAG: InlB B-repeat-containing protein, partial [Oscillospiraceae bacterium]|nr:InlB B-repeat-containing protein [Oscillospiraceae bacterium]